MSIAERSAEATPAIMSVEEFLALPDDGVRRELIRGELRERGSTIRDRFHAATEATIAYLLGNWLDTRPGPCGEVVSGEAGFRLRGTKDSAIGVDVAYVSPELVAATGAKQAIFDGPPALAVEVLSPSDTHEDVAEKIGLYLEVGTIAWVVDPDLKTVAIYRPGGGHTLRAVGDEVADEPYLPGFRARVADIFA